MWDPCDIILFARDNDSHDNKGMIIVVNKKGLERVDVIEIFYIVYNKKIHHIKLDI